MMKIIKLDPDGGMRTITIANDRELQVLVGGYVEPVPGVNRVRGSTQWITMLVNEDNLDGHLTDNPYATALARVLGGTPQPLAGTALFVGECEEDYCSLTDESVTAINELADAMF